MRAAQGRSASKPRKLKFPATQKVDSAAVLKLKEKIRKKDEEILAIIQQRDEQILQKDEQILQIRSSQTKTLELDARAAGESLIISALICFHFSPHSPTLLVHVFIDQLNLSNPTCTQSVRFSSRFVDQRP
jgi:hypothetical protein